MSKLTLFGLLGTGLYLTFLLAISSASHEKFSGMDPNAWGDFLAGTVGPLALIWLVLGYFQQGKELRNSVDTLKMQARELSLSVEQQRELVAATRETVEFEKARGHELEATRKNSVQPKFLVEFGPLAIHGNVKATYLLRIKNGGELCADVVVDATSNKETIAFQKVAIFDALKHEVRAYAFDGKPVPEFSEKIVVTIVYIDRDGEKMQAVFDLEKPTEGKPFARHETTIRSVKPKQ